MADKEKDLTKEVKGEDGETRRVSTDGTHLGDTTTDVVSTGGAKVGDMVFAVHDEELRDKPLSDIRVAPAMITAVNGEKDDKGGVRVNAKLFHDSHETTWVEDVNLYDSHVADDDKEERERRFNEGVYLVRSI